MKAWLQLARLPNLPSAVSNILAGYTVAHGIWSPGTHLGLLVVASGCFYSAGMILNDVFDVEEDRNERPNRPIPSGAISLTTAATVGISLLALGLVVATAAGLLATSGSLDDLSVFQRPLGRVALIATLLVGSIILYDGPLKRSFLAPFMMGSCRTLNVLLGASTYVPEVNAVAIDPVFGLPWCVWCLALTLGILITGVTLLARNEASLEQKQSAILRAIAVILVGAIGIATIAFCPISSRSASATAMDNFESLVQPLSNTAIRGFILFLLVVYGLSFRYLLSAARNPTPTTVQTAVVAILRSLIMIDAAVVFLFARGILIYPLVTAALLLPARLLGRFIRST